MRLRSELDKDEFGWWNFSQLTGEGTHLCLPVQVSVVDVNRRVGMKSYFVQVSVDSLMYKLVVLLLIVFIVDRVPTPPGKS